MSRIHKIGLASLAAFSVVTAIAASSASMFAAVQPDYMSLNVLANGEPTTVAAQEPETVLTNWTYTGRSTTNMR